MRQKVKTRNKAAFEKFEEKSREIMVCNNEKNEIEVSYDLLVICKRIKMINLNDDEKARLERLLFSFRFTV